MSREKRVNEILATMKAFEKEAYLKKDILGELLELQKELVNATFEEEHAENANL